MTLRRKLLTAFGALALLGLLVVGVTVFAVAQWASTEETLRGHYVRSLRAQEVRAVTFRAFKEIPDALATVDPNARQEFQQALQPLDRVFEQWSALADDPNEQQQVQQVQQAVDALITDAGTVFDLVDQGRRPEAVQLVESVLEDQDFARFEELTAAAVDSDRQQRQALTEQTESIRHSTGLVLAVTAVGVLALTLLIGAYLSGDIFAPLRQLRAALQDLAAGDVDTRVDDQRRDELGEANRAFNRLAEQLSDRDWTGSVGDGAVTDGAGANGSSRDTLDRLLSGLRDDVAELRSTGITTDPTRTAALLTRIDGLTSVITRIADYADTVGLRLSSVEPAALLRDVVDRIDEEVITRRISVQYELDAALGPIRVDRIKMRSTLSELTQNALDALPELGGRLTLRARIIADDTISLEVEDNGTGIPTDDLDGLLNRADRDVNPSHRVGLRLATTVVQQHGGRLLLKTRPGGGTLAQVLLPARD